MPLNAADRRSAAGVALGGLPLVPGHEPEHHGEHQEPQQEGHRHPGLAELPVVLVVDDDHEDAEQACEDEGRAVDAGPRVAG